MQLTLVPSGLARPGYSFWFKGANEGEECQDCPVQAVCFRLRPGRRYTVTSVRGVEHPCRLHEGDKVRVCEVEERPFVTSTEASSLRGTALTWEPVPCGYPECPNNRLCHPVGPPPRVPSEVLEAGDAIPCPMHFDLRRVTLQPLD